MFQMWLAYDLETTFLKKGMKRHQAKILEIGMYAKDVTLQCLINPLEKYATGEEVIESLESTGQHPEKTLHFWTKLLIEKKALKSDVKRKEYQEQANAISTLLKRSDIAMEYVDDQKMAYALEKTNDNVKEAEDLLGRTMLKGFSPLFYNTKDTLERALKLGDGHTWVAHNGKSFDEKVIKGQGVEMHVTFGDSLPFFRARLPGELTYSLPLLYRRVLKKKYKAHHAFEDAKALFTLLEHFNGYHDKSDDLHTVRGVGSKSIVVFNKHKIFTRQDLDKYVEEHSREEFLKTFSNVHAYKALAQRLYKI